MLFLSAMSRYARWWTSIVEWTISSCTASRSQMACASKDGFLAVGRSFAGHFTFAPGALVDDLVTPMVGHLFPFARLELGPQTAGTKAGPAIEAALLDTW
jgi:hypothetical protein